MSKRKPSRGTVIAAGWPPPLTARDEIKPPPAALDTARNRAVRFPGEERPWSRNDAKMADKLARPLPSPGGWMGGKKDD